MKQIMYFLSYLYLFLCFLSCHQKEAEKEWIHIINENVYIWAESNNQSFTYDWTGNSFDKLAHGDGTLSVYKNDSLIDKREITAYYGNVALDGVVALSDSSFYIGKIHENLFEGFGVYLKGQDVYVGTFKKSKPNGYLNWYRSGMLYYSGQWQDGQFQGEGSLYKEDGSLKTGIWKNGALVNTYCQRQTAVGYYDGYVLNSKPDGVGTMHYKDSSYYTGEWSEGRWNGKGVFNSSTDSIDGMWRMGTLNGFAVLKNMQYKYEGIFKDNAPEGVGSIYLSDSSRYIGEWIAGERSGYGDMIFSNSDSYQGEWLKNRFDGIGKYEFSDKKQYYDGEWENELQNGNGTYISEEFQYIGNWEDGWINGEGHIVYANGDFYEGNFVENEKFGIGYYHFKDGNSYEGEFVDDTFNGLGIFHFIDGNIYEGEFQNGKIKGDGTLYYIEKNDTIAFTAYWDGTNNFPKLASVLFNNGDLYEGELINGFPTANGIWTTKEERDNNEQIVPNDSKRANEFYKRHKNRWNKIVNYTSVALTVVQISAPIVSTIMLATPAAPFAPLVLAAGKGAGAANYALNVADAAIVSTSAAVDIYETINQGEDATEAVKALAGEVALNAAFILVPKALTKIPARKTLVGLSTTAKSSTSKSSIAFSRNKVFGKTISISKDRTGTLAKTVSNGKKQITLKRRIQSTYLESRLAKTLIMKYLQNIINKGPIILSDKELRALLNNPKYYRGYVLTYTGKKKNFQEFFIRLSMGDKNQVKQILEVPGIREVVDRSIRCSGEGGVHEWLMTKNFTDFLTNPRWGDDGKFLALSLTELVQGTKTVAFKNGGTHFSKENSGRFHRGLAKIIDNCSSKEELFLEVKKYAKETLTKESYDEFVNIFIDVFNTNKILI
ncbi:MAG: MORN repeat-containing protein [Phocaeicola sp.]